MIIQTNPLKSSFANNSDIDECGSESHRCVTETELCKNIIGGYFCDCKPGYEKTTFGNCTGRLCLIVLSVRNNFNCNGTSSWPIIGCREYHMIPKVG